MVVGELVRTIAPAWWAGRIGVVAAVYGNQIVVNFKGLRVNFLAEELELWPR